MNYEKNLDYWRERADRWLTPMESVKSTVRTTRESLDKDHPSWKSAYEASQNDYLKHDARREFFVTMRVILQNAQLSYLYMRDQLSDEDWWIKQHGKFRSIAAIQALREYALMIKFFTIHALAMTLEETFRAIVRSAPKTFTVSPEGSFQSVYRHMLKVVSLQKFSELFEVIRNTRNTIHTNGIFRPKDGKNVQIIYKGRSFDFEVGRPLIWLQEDFLVWLPTELNEAMINIITSQPVATISKCPRRQKKLTKRVIAVCHLETMCTVGRVGLKTRRFCWEMMVFEEFLVYCCNV